MSKKTQKFLSVLLSLLFVVGMIPLRAFAAASEHTGADKSTVNATATEQEPFSEEATQMPYILSEDVQKREESIKHFRMSDGTMQAVQYAAPVHFEKDGVWTEYDNTLVEVDAEESEKAVTTFWNSLNKNKELVNKNADFTVRLSKKTNGKKFVHMEKGGYAISWYYENAKKSTAQQQKTIKDANPATLEEISSVVCYEDVFTATDFEYIVSSQGVKENLLLKSTKAPTAFTAIYKANGLIPVPVDEKTIELRTNDGICIYTIRAPFMEDANGSISTGITLALGEIKNGTFSIMLSLDTAWLQADDRAYPVVVDPLLETSQDWNDATNCHSAYISSSNPNACYGRGGAAYEGSLYVGKTNGRGQTRTLIKTPNLPDLDIADKVIHAEMAVFVTACYPELRIDLHRVTTPWEQSTVCWNTGVGYDDTVLDYQLVQSMERYDENKTRWQRFEITDLVRGWYSGEYENNGVLLRSDSEFNTTQARAWMLSTGYTTNPIARPVLQIQYRNMSGYESYWSYTNLSAGRGGVASVNPYNGNLVYSQPITQNAGGNLLPVDLSFVLNSNASDPDYSYLGAHMQTNYHIYVRYDAKMEERGYKYYMNDADGTRHWFYKTDNPSEFKDEDGLGLLLKEIAAGSVPSAAEARYEVVDKDQNKMYFNSWGRLIQLSNPQGVTACVQYETVDGVNRMKSIIDGAGRAYTFEYLSSEYPNTIACIIDPAGRATRFCYTRGTVTQVIFADGECVDLAYDYANCTLTHIYGIDQTRVFIEYDASAQKRVSEINWGVSNGNLLERYNFAYKQNTTQITDLQGRSYAYQFNDQGQTTGVVSETDGTAQVFKFSSGNSTDSRANKLLQSSRALTSVQNYVENPGFADALSRGYWVYTENSENQTVSIDASRQNLTSNALKIHKDASNASRVNAVQRVTQLPEGMYTLSGYLNTEGVALTGSAWIGVEIRDANENFISAAFDDGTHITNGWERTRVPFYVPANSEVRIVIGFWAADSGTVWYDDLQLEKGENVSPFNLVENAGFHNGSTKWSDFSGNEPICTWAGLSGFDDCCKLQGAVHTERGIAQQMPVSGKKGEVLNFGMWVYAASAPVRNATKDDDAYQPLCEINLNYYDTNGAWAGYSHLDCNADLKNEWQFVAEEVLIPIDYSRLVISFVYDYNVNNAYMTGAFCYKEQHGQTFDYDKDGNLVSVVDLANANSAFSYSGNQKSKMLNPSGSAYFYGYDDNQNLNYALSTDGQSYGFSYDGKGNVTHARVESRKLADGLQDGKTYLLINAYSGYALDSSEQNYNSAPVFTTNYIAPRIQQHWRFEAVPGEQDVFSLKALGFENRYLDVYDGNAAHGEHIGTYPYNGSVAQRFKFVQQKDGSYAIFTCASQYDRCIDAQFEDNKEIKPCVPIRQSNCDSQLLKAGQRWFIYVLDDDTHQTIQTDAAYTPDGNFVSSQTDQRGNETGYVYDTQKGTLTETTDANGNKTEYVYDANSDQLLSVTAGGVTNRYAYEKDRLKNIQVNGALQYQFQYDVFGRTVSTKVGNGTNWRELSGLSYNAAGLLEQQTYGNGDRIDFAYDRLDRITEKRYNGDNNQRAVYSYGTDGNLAQTYDYLSGTRTRFVYDLVGRVVEQREYASVDIQGGTLRNSTKLTYADRTNYLTGVEHFSPLGTQTIGYRYGDLSKGEMPDQIYAVTWNGSEKVRCAYDGLGRLQSKTIGGVLQNRYLYENVSADRTTTLVQTVETAAGTYTYTYDKLGNITAISDGTYTTSYVYDALNQLVRSNDEKAGKTYTYAYQNGNITEKKEYAYTTGALGEVLHTTTWRYDDNSWGDLLTSWNGKPITYDAIGNPLTIGSSTLSWQGRQLQSITDGANTYAYRYNIDGQRLAKTVNGVTTEYFYNGNILAGEKTGDNTLVFLYDNNGDAFGFTYNGTEYFYVKNAQNDVVAIADASGAVIARYSYDDWGGFTAVTDANGVEITDKTQIAHRNPLRYRSYYYDSETGFYHLQTRYYVPEFCRFLNADGIYDTNTGILSHNMFAYCNNNPSNAVDEEGTFALTFSVASICVYYAIMGVAVIGAMGAIWSQPKTQQAVSRIAETVTATAKKTVGRVRDKTTQKQKNRDNEPRKHHIVAKAAWRAAESRKILEDVNIKPYTDSKNLITISHGLHKSMHTKRYYAYVNEKLRPCAGNREAVEAALLELRADIAYADATGIKRWEVL